MSIDPEGKLETVSAQQVGGEVRFAGQDPERVVSEGILHEFYRAPIQPRWMHKGSQHYCQAWQDLQWPVGVDQTSNDIVMKAELVKADARKKAEDDWQRTYRYSMGMIVSPWSGL
jgi:hypothetical protein